MGKTRRGNGRAIVVIGLMIVATVVGITAYWLNRSPLVQQISVNVPPPTTAPATQPVTTQIMPAVLEYVDVVRAKYPEFPATQPLGVPVDFDEAARIILDQPIHIGPRQDLWITHPSALPTSEVLAKAADEQVHVVRRHVVFVFWTPENNDSSVNEWIANIIIRTGEGVYEHVIPTRRTRIGSQRKYDWARAFSWNSRVVVPTDHGVSLFDFATPDIVETFHALAEPDTPGLARPQLALDTRGLLAWIPWDAGHTGSRGASRFVDGTWTTLDDAAGWPEKILHLVPLLDGSVLRIVVANDDAARVEPQLVVLDAAPVDEQQIATLVAQLSDPDEEIRTTAFNELTRYGPGLWPLLEAMIDDQPAEAQVRLRQLLGNRIRPTLGGMTLLDGRMRVVGRYDNGGALFYAEAGVSVPAGDGRETMVVPAWISCRPGRAITLLPHALVRDVDPDKFVIKSFGNEWVLVDPVLGPRRFMGNHLLTLLKENEREFRDVLGVDRRGRWLFVKENSATRQTLIIDPTLPDPTPRLPAWTMHIREGSVGWTRDNWPAIRRGGGWVLEAEGWRPLDDEGETMQTEPTPETTDNPSTIPSTTQASGHPLCIDAHGCSFYGGQDSLVRVAADGTSTAWPLPPEATGLDTYPPVLIASDEALFLFNQPGRVVQIAEQKDGSLSVRHIFTENIPNADPPTRIWRDPAGRIVVAHGTNQLAVLFPSGRVPSAIRLLMMSDDE